MANFNVNDYETVAERLVRFWANPENADARIVTMNHTSLQDRQVSTWVIEARIYLSAADQANDLPKATGWAFEVDGQGMTQKTSALETAETSAIGRCLANMNYSGNKRATREEMQKVERGVTPVAPKVDWSAHMEAITSKEQARKLYGEALGSGADVSVLKQIESLAAKYDK